VVLSAVLTDGVEDDRNKLVLFSDEGLGDELSNANLLDKGTRNPLADEVVLLLCRTVLLVNEKLLCICSVEVLFCSLTPPLVVMLLSDSKGLLE